MSQILRPVSVFFLLLFVVSSLKAQIRVNATAGTTGPVTYGTLSQAFDAVNAGTHRGAITVLVTANTTETATATLNASGTGSANYTSVQIRPNAGANPVISGSISSGPLVRLLGSNNVTIEGSNNGTDSRDLTIANTSTVSSNVLLIGSSGTTPVSNVTVRNTVLSNGTNTSTAVLIGSGTIVGNPGFFNNINLVNNSVRRAYIGYYLYATVAAGNGSATIERNDLNSTGSDAIRLVGIYVQGANGVNIRNNNIGNFETVSPEFDRAIWLATATTNTTVSGNNITGLNYSGSSSYAPIGINISSGVNNSNIVVSDNTIGNISSNGIYLPSGIFCYSAMSGVTISGNQISNIRNTNTTGYGAVGILLQNTSNTAATRIFNNFVWGISGYGFDGYDVNDNGNGIVVDGGGGYEIYYNTVVMNAEQSLTGAHKASCFLVTSNVTAVSSIALRNNIFTNLQTVGNATSRLAIANLGPANVFSAIDHNVYYSTSTNLSSRGTNASFTNTLAQLQTSLGDNANSRVIQPVFAGPDDLHLNRNVNLAINGMAAPIAGITLDIDREVRDAATPDPGADEFTPCLTVAFTTHPQPVSICAATGTSFTVAATNAVIYQWQVDEGSGFTDLANSAMYAGVNTSTLTLSNVPDVVNGFIYRCAVSSGAGCTFFNSDPAVLTVGTPVSISTGPAHATIPHLDNAIFDVTAAGTGPYTYQWQVDEGSGFSDLANTGVYTGVATAAMTITGATVAMNGYQYRCRVNACGTEFSSAATLTVNQLAQTLSFATQTNGSTINVIYGDPVINAAASSSAGLPVTYISGNTAVIDVDATGQVTIIGVGTTTITVSQAGDAVHLPAANISFTVTVDARDITVTARQQTKIYGDGDPTFTYTSNIPLIGTDVFTGVPDRDPGENTGTYQINQNTLTAGPNYNITFNSNVLTITPKELTITADDKTRQYGAANPPLTFSYSGFAFTDDETNLTTIPVAGTAAVPSSWPGDYPITLAGGVSGNYTFTYVPARLTVEPILLNFDQQPADSRICADDRAIFTTAVTATPSIAPVAYQWEFSTDAMNWSALPQGPTSSYTTRASSSPGYYRCKITIPGSDLYSQAAELTLYPVPVVLAAKSNDLDCAFSSARLSASGAVSYLWTPAAGLDDPAIANPIATPDRTTTFLVTGTDGNGCKGTARVTVTYTPSGYNVPNAFTPNNDGKNDCFGVRHWQKVTDFSMTIYNRWGNRIFHTTDVSKCWDGTINDIAQPSGTYVFYIRGMAPCGLIERKGSLMLLR